MSYAKWKDLSEGKISPPSDSVWLDVLIKICLTQCIFRLQFFLSLSGRRLFIWAWRLQRVQEELFKEVGSLRSQVSGKTLFMDTLHWKEPLCNSLEIHNIKLSIHFGKKERGISQWNLKVLVFVLFSTNIYTYLVFLLFSTHILYTRTYHNANRRCYNLLCINQLEFKMITNYLSH